jgi:hypothetical protein
MSFFFHSRQIPCNPSDSRTLKSVRNYHERMNSAQQSLFSNQPEHFGQILLLDIRNSGEHSMGFRGEPYVNGLEWFAHSLGIKSGRWTRSNPGPRTRPEGLGEERGGQPHGSVGRQLARCRCLVRSVPHGSAALWQAHSHSLLPNKATMNATHTNMIVNTLNNSIDVM